MGRCWLWIVIGSSACRGPSANALPYEPDAAAVGNPARTTDESESEPGAGGSATRDPISASADAGALPPAQGDGGAFGAIEGCGADPVTLDEIHSGRVRSGFAVAVHDLVASSQKFLVSEAKSGSCLWGAFAAASGRTGAGSGLFLVSFGAPHREGEACTPGADGLPDDLKPGERLDVEGTFDDYAPAACDGVAPAQQLRVDVACPVRRGALQAEPEAAVIDHTLADRLAVGHEPQLLRDWGGALVRLEGVAALQDADDGDAVYPFGVVRLQETALEVHSRLYYFDLRDGGPRAAAKAPHYGYPTAFRSITGIVFLDYCTWVVAPRDRCADLSPESEGCADQARRP
jgi:hypothetical protein